MLAPGKSAISVPWSDSPPFEGYQEADLCPMGDAGGSLSGITKRYSRRGSWVLNGIDLELPPCSKTMIVGDNGSGKSTLLRIGAGVSWPNEGTVRLPDRIGYVPERLAARTRFTGAEYLSHMGRIRGLSAREVRARCRELLERLELQPGPNEPIESLSKGNRQKLVLAQAFLGPVGLLVLDEPFSGLDPIAHAALNELAHEAQSTGTAVLVSSHRSVPREAGLRQLRIENGHLAELRMDDPTQAGVAPAMAVRLLATDEASDGQSVAAIPGVLDARLEGPSGLLVVVTDPNRIDAVLLEAIRQGWSVRSVQDVVREASHE
jgi:ABC-type multidrug transport system ATPase subunit